MEFYLYTLKLILVPNFSSLRWFSFLSAVYQLSSAVDSWWQLLLKKIDWNGYLHTKVYTFAKFQLSRLIFIFVSFWQLLSAVDSWWQLSQKKCEWDFHLPPKCDICAKFEVSRLLLGLAKECDGHGPGHWQLIAKIFAKNTHFIFSKTRYILYG